MGDNARLPQCWTKTLAAPGVFRLGLALVVVVHHLTRFKLGTAAVEVFFVLSGYWITLMWRARYSRARGPYLTYLVSRAWRLLPTFWLSVAITWWIAGSPEMLADVRHIFSNIALLGYAQLQRPLVVPAWSLDIEMQFYLLAPLLIAMIGTGKSRIGIALAATLLISLASWSLLGQQTLPAMLIFFMIGVTAAIGQWRPSFRLADGGLIVAALAVTGLLLSPWRSVMFGGPHAGAFSGYNGLINLGLAALAIPWAIRSTHQTSDPNDRALGELSYPFYLLHWAGVVWLGRYATPLALGPRIAATLGVCAVVGLGSVLVWRFWDHPLNRLRTQWVSNRIAR
jgi:peptidoglycan/LPS O-acetylase OafA/YrhL